MSWIWWVVLGIDIIFVDALLWVAFHGALSTGLNRHLNERKQESR